MLLLELVFIFTVYPLKSVELAAPSFLNVNVTLLEELTLALAVNVQAPVIVTFVLNVDAELNCALADGSAVHPVNVYPESTVPVIACVAPNKTTTLPPLLTAVEFIFNEFT